MAVGNDNIYRMLVLLEEEVPAAAAAATATATATVGDEVGDSDQPRMMHEFVDELPLPIGVDEIDTLNKWFDEFDEQICIPNEGHIKYEITSDGMIVLILDKTCKNVVSEVRQFVAQHELPDPVSNRDNGAE